MPIFASPVLRNSRSPVLSRKAMGNRAIAAPDTNPANPMRKGKLSWINRRLKLRPATMLRLNSPENKPAIAPTSNKKGISRAEKLARDATSSRFKSQSPPPSSRETTAPTKEARMAEPRVKLETSCKSSSTTNNTPVMGALNPAANPAAAPAAII